METQAKYIVYITQYIVGATEAEKGWDSNRAPAR